MGQLSDITCGKTNIDTSINPNDGIENVFAKAYIENQGNENNPNNHSDEKFVVDRSYLKLNDSNIDIIFKSNKDDFVLSNGKLPNSEERAVKDLLHNIPTNIKEGLISNGWKIRLIDLDVSTFSQIFKFSTIIDGYTQFDTKIIALPNLSNYGQENAVYGRTMQVLAHEIGHALDRMFNFPSNCSEWREICQHDKDNFIAMGERTFFSDIGFKNETTKPILESLKMEFNNIFHPDKTSNPYYRNYPSETFAESIGKYFVDGNNYLDRIDNKATPEITKFIEHFINTIDKYYERIKELDHSLDDYLAMRFECIEEISPTMKGRDYEENHNVVNPEDAPKYPKYA